MSGHFLSRALSLLLLAATLGFVALRLLSTPFESSVMTLLTGEDHALEERVIERLDCQMMFLVGSDDEAVMDGAADALRSALAQSGIFLELSSGADADHLAAFAAEARHFRTTLLDDALRQKIISGEAGAEAVSSLYLGFGAVSGSEIASDPLLLTRHLITAQAADNPSRISLENSRYTVHADDGTWRVLIARLEDDAVSQNADRTVALVERALADVSARFPGARILKRGSLFYSEFAARSAAHDLSFLGSLTVIGVVLLMFLAFRAFTAVALTALSVACALLGGTAFTLLVFGRLHLVVMVLGLSVIGICTDYTVYFLTRRLECGDRESPLESLAFLRRELLTALATTVVAYVIVMFSPFEAVRQLSVFCIAGLVYAMICVMNLEPALCGRMRSRGTLPFAPWLEAHLTAGRSRAGTALIIIITLLSAAGLFCVRPDDDPMAMQRMPGDLVAQEHEIAAITGAPSDQRWVLVSADSEVDFLIRLGMLRQAVARAGEQGILQKALIPRLNDPATQKRDREIIADAVKKLAPTLAALGIRVDVDCYHADSFADLRDYLNSGLGRSFRELVWRGDSSPRLTLLSPLMGLDDPAAFRELLRDLKGISLIDRRADFTSLFKSFRESAQLSVAMALGLILLMALLRLGLAHGLRAFVPSLLSLVAALGIPALLGFSLNLFSVLALILVLGIGLDYVLFFSNPRAQNRSALFATTVAMLTTVLSLGVLAFSGTAVIAGFGLTLSAGIVTAWLAAPLAARDLHFIGGGHD